MHGQTSWLIGVAGIIAVIAIFGGQLIGKASFLTAEVFNAEGKSCQIGFPIYGSYKCQALPGASGTNPTVSLTKLTCSQLKNNFGAIPGEICGIDLGILYDSAKFTCGANPQAYVPNCQYTLNRAAGSWLSGNKVWARLNSAEWLSASLGSDASTFDVSSLFGGAIAAGNKIEIITDSYHLYNTSNAKIWQTQYRLERTANGAFVSIANSQSCSLAEVSDKGKTVINCVAGGGDNCNSPEADLAKPVPYDEYRNFLQNIVPSLGSQVLGQKNVYNGEEVDCQGTYGSGAALRRYDIMNTHDSCVAVPNEVIAGPAQGIECCNTWGATTTSYCKDFKLQPIGSGIPCSTSMACPGNGILAPDDTASTPAQPVASRWSCEQNFCKKVETKNVQCISGQNCANGQLCDLTTFTCVTQTGSGGISCGDGACTERYESYLTCEQDCTPPDKGSVLGSLLKFIGVFLAGLIISAVLLLILAFLGPFKWLLADRQQFVIYWVALALGLSFLFAIPLGIFAASIGLV